MIDLQSSATALQPCPSRTFENSQQHARVIYGWVHRPLKTQSPKWSTEILLVWKIVAGPETFGVPSLSNASRVSAKPFQASFPNLSRAFTSLFQTFQGVPSLSKPFFRKKDCL